MQDDSPLRDRRWIGIQASSIGFNPLTYCLGALVSAALILADCHGNTAIVGSNKGVGDKAGDRPQTCFDI